MKKLKRSKSILYKRSGGEKVLYAFVFVFFVIYSLALILPYVWGFLSSLKTPFEYFEPFSMPEKLQWSNYVTALTSMSVENISLLDMFWNSIWFTFGSIIISVECYSLQGYMLSKYRVKGRNFILALIIFVMVIPVYGTFPAAYKLYHDIKLVDSYLILITAIGAVGFNTLIMMSFYDNVSWTYAEAGMIDGANHFQIYWRIIRPQAKPIILTLLLLAFIGKWNDYMNPLLYLPNKLTLATGIYKYQEVAARRGNYPIYFAALSMFVAPCLLVYAFFSKRLMENLSVGGIKA